MVNITRAEKLGFCSGAKNAIKKVEKLKSAYVLGDVVHNKQVMEWLADQDKIVIDGVDDHGFVIPNENSLQWLNKKGKDPDGYSGMVDRPVVITAHGAEIDVFEKLKKLKIDVRDTTCEKVKKIYTAGETLEKQGYRVAIYGDKDHAEIRGIASRLNNPIFLTNGNFLNIQKMPSKLGLICQSTSIQSNFLKVANLLKSNLRDVKIVNTICHATQNRQKSVLELSKVMDVVIVIGGEHSSNTTKLKEIAEVNCPTYHIQTPDQLQKSWFSNTKRIGITAGASTAPWLIESVERAVNTNFPDI